MELRFGMFRTIGAMLMLILPKKDHPKRWQSIILVATVGALLLLEVGVNFGSNLWNRYFFDALEKRAAQEVQWLALVFIGLIVVAGVTSMAAIWARLRLQILWRELVTRRVTSRWISNNAFYRMTVMTGTAEYPEQRIAEDVRLGVEPIVDLTSGLTTSLLNLIMFSGVLWVAGGSADFMGVTIPGAMFLAAVIYAFLVSSAMVLVGGKLARRISSRSQAEASYRYALTRVRENAESIALLHAGDAEKRILSAEFDGVIDRWLAYARTWSAMTFVISANGLAHSIVPVLLMSPKYLSGDVTLGAVTQVAAAFGTVQAAAGWFTSNFAALSQWYASATRVMQLVDSIALADDQGSMHSRIQMQDSSDDKLRLEWVAVDLHSGQRLIAEANVEISPGDATLVEGASGTGKSTLLRAMAGIWPWGSGAVQIPPDAKVMFLPQRPYLPHGRLAAALAYPSTPDTFTTEEFAEVLVSTGLQELVPLLEEGVSEAWDRKLSGGEQQRISFARVLLHKPDIAFLDEATSALDEPGQVRLMELFLTRLYGTTVVSVAHRPSLARYHAKRLYLRQDDTEVTIAERNASHDTTWHGMRAALRQLRNTPA
ncbi:MAG: ABC transporter ATP-binding protein/permease [Hyphomicrobiaceae bacterium]|nr:ABC transporter ATP-binding protein/permease [Hyphomicrobiaceae bacterium]